MDRRGGGRERTDAVQVTVSALAFSCLALGILGFVASCFQHGLAWMPAVFVGAVVAGVLLRIFGRDAPRLCPRCREEAEQTIYYGLPMWLCPIEACRTLFGFWSFIATWLPFNGWFFVYTGPYLPALVHWLRCSDEEEE